MFLTEGNPPVMFSSNTSILPGLRHLTPICLLSPVPYGNMLQGLHFQLVMGLAHRNAKFSSTQGSQRPLSWMKPLPKHADSL